MSLDLRAQTVGIKRQRMQVKLRQPSVKRLILQRPRRQPHYPAEQSMPMKKTEKHISN
jgi:hypothetical protein